MKLMKYDEIINNEELTAEYDLIKELKPADLANLVIDILNEHSNEDKLANANKIGDLIIFLLNERGLIRDGGHQTFVDILLAASLIHNIIDITEDNWEEVYKIRKIVTKASMKYETIPDQAIESICDTIENQLGEKMPIKGSRPNPNTPGEIFAMAVAIVNRYM